MSEPAIRSRLLRLRRDLRAAEEGRNLLDRKREAIVRTIAERSPRCARHEAAAGVSLAAAREAVRGVQTQIGRAAVDGAALAQEPPPPLSMSDTIVVGVKIPRADLEPARFMPRYGPAGVPASLDHAGAAVVAALSDLAALASEAVALRRLRAALARTARRLNALDQIVLPSLAEQVRAIDAALEEEERDESTRRTRWVAGVSPDRIESR